MIKDLASIYSKQEVSEANHFTEEFSEAISSTPVVRDEIEASRDKS